MHRIEALKDFGNVKAGDLGGFVESEDNLGFADAENNGNFDHEDRSWIYDDSIVYGSSDVKWESFVSGDSVVKDTVFENGATVSDESVVKGSFLGHNAEVEGSIVENSKVYISEVHLMDLKDSEIVDSKVHTSTIEGSFVEGSHVLFGSEIHDSHLEHVNLFRGRENELDTRVSEPESNISEDLLADLNESDSLEL